MSKGFASNYRILVLATGLFGVFGAVGTRLAWLHVIDRDSYLRNLVKARRQIIVEKARRGDILDRHDAILATSHSLLVVGVDPSALRRPDDKLRAKDEQKWPQLAALLGVPLPELKTIFATRYRESTPVSAAPTKPITAAPVGPPFAFDFSLPSGGPTSDSVANPGDSQDEDLQIDPATDAAGRHEIKWAKLAENISESTYAEVEKLNIRGIYGNRVYRRSYPHNQLAAHVIGFVDHAQQPATGIERYADFYLRAQDGWREGERDGRANELAQFRTRDVPHADGYTVKLTIDANVQDLIEQEIATIAQKYQPLKATIVVSDPRTGFILGLGNYPNFNPNEYNKVSKEEAASMKNIALTDIYEPGSVFKIVAASGALEEGLVTPSSMFDCSLEKIDYRGMVRSLPGEDHHFEDPRHVPLTRVISFSSNRGAAQLAMKLGEQRFYDYARAFGFGQRTGLPGGHEEPGIMASPAKWDGLTITRMPMGQSVAVTVMQMHQAMSVIASDGVLLRPQIIREICDASNEPVYKFDRAEVRRVISERTARTMAQMLTGVASTEGTAPEAAISGYEVAGKTGTAQKFIDGKPSKTHHVVSFIGFFPASRPQVEISVIVDDADAHCPGGVAYGKAVAAPVFKHIGEQLIPLLDIKSGQPAIATNFVAFDGGHR